MNDNDGDEHGDVNDFWLERDHLKDADKVNASVFITHGSQDDNVRFNHATDLVGGAEGPQRAAEDVDHAHGARGSVRLPARPLGRHPAPLVRPLAPGS